MELARVFSMPDVTTDVTIRFALWNGEEGGLTWRKRVRGSAQGPSGPAERARSGSA
jgi:hypothetical protein